MTLHELPDLPDLPGVVSSAELARTAAHIAGHQQADGLIPWFTGHHADPWDHVEAAMALTVAGRLDAARAAFAWSARQQAADGSWPMEIVGDVVRERSTDANQCTYLAVGVWHHWTVTRDRRWLEDMWPVVAAAIGFGLDLQRADGTIAWSRDPDGVPGDHALLTGSACMVLALRSALALAEVLDDPHPDWELSAAALAHAVAAHPERFADKGRYSMDWYYPVLGGAVRGGAARELLDRRWDEFVHPGRGIRCVADRPWITGAETCELVLTLDAIGDVGRASRLLSDMQFLRTADGGYWTGWVAGDDVHWPAEQSTWTAAAVILAADALARHSPAHHVFRGDDLPELLPWDRCDHCDALPRGQR